MRAWIKSYVPADLVVLYSDISGGMCFKILGQGWATHSLEKVPRLKHRTCFANLAMPRDR